MDYEIALYENGTPSFQFIYGSITPATVANDSELVVGVKKDDVTFTQFECDPSGGLTPPVSSGQQLTANCVTGATPTTTPTPTATASGTPTPSPTATASVTPTVTPKHHAYGHTYGYS